MKQRVELRRAKLPPILEIDEDGIPVSEMDAASWQRPRWSADGEMPNVQMGDWPTEFDD
jgi:hypothetical protein